MPAAVATALYMIPGIWTIGAMAITALSYAVTFTAMIGIGQMQRRRAERSARDAWNASLKDRTVMAATVDAARSRVYGRVRNVDGILFIGSHGAHKEKLVIVVAVAGHEVDAIETVYFNDEPVTLDGDASGGWVTDAPYATTKSTPRQTIGTISGGSGSVTLPATPVGAVYAAYSTGGPPDGYDIALSVSVAGKVVSYSGGVPNGAQIRVSWQEAVTTSKARVWKFLGAPGQNIGADSSLSLSTKFTGAGGSPKITTTNHRGAGIACVAVEFDYDQDAFPSGLPQISAKVRGAKVKDPRTGATAWSENPSVIGRDWALFANGGACLPAELDEASFIAAANASDVSHSFARVGKSPLTAKMFTAGIVCKLDADPWQQMGEIVEAMAGKAGWAGGRLRVRAGQYVAPVAEITEDWISDKESVQIVAAPSRQDLFNIVRPTIADAANNYTVAPAPEIRAAAYITLDGAEYPVEVQYGAVTDQTHAQHVAGVALRDSRSGLTCSLPCNMRAYTLELFDVVRVTLPRFGWAQKQFEVVSWQWSLTGGITLGLKETAASIFDPDAEFSSVDATPNTALPKPWEVPKVTGVVVTSGTAALTDGSIITRTRVAFDAVPSEAVQQSGKVEIAWTLATEALPAGDWPGQTEGGGATFSDVIGLKTASFYLFRVRAINSVPVRGPWSDWTLHLVAPPPRQPLTFRSETEPTPPHVAGDLWMRPSTGYVQRWSGAAWESYASIGGEGATGPAGPPGADGVSIRWRGESASPPASPLLNDSYRNTGDGRVYIWTGSAWALMVLDGSNGQDGAKGADGLSVFITYHDNPLTTTPAAPTGSGATGGWHTNATAAAVWMSQKVAASAGVGSWGAPIPIRGANGQDGAPGPDGTPALMAMLSNDSHTVPTASDGTGGVYAGAVTTITIYAGTTDQSALWSITATPSSGVTGSLSGRTYTVSAMSVDAGYVDLTAMRSGYPTLAVRFTLAKAKAGAAGSPGTNGTRTAVLDMYRWSASAPTTWPSGSSTYTWATGQFTAPATLNGWSLTPPAAVLGQTLYIVRQVYADSGTSATTAITWSANTARPAGAAGTNGTPGTPGANGQRVGVLEVYRWAATAPTTYPSGTSTYTWATGAFTAPTTANGWSLVPGAAVAGQTLWGISVSVSDALTTTTSTATWNSATVYAVGAAGSDGSPGANATAYWLITDAPAIKRDTAGVYTPAALAITAISATGTAAPAAYAGRFIIADTTNGTTWTNRYTSGVNESAKGYTPGAGIVAVRVRLYLAGGTSTLLDEEVIPVVEDGARNWETLNGRPALFRVTATGGSATGYPKSSGLYDAETGATIHGGSRSYMLVAILRGTGAIAHQKTYDIYGNGEQTPGVGYGLLGVDLHFFADRPGQYIVILYTADEPKQNRTLGNIPLGIYRNGGSRAIFGNPNFRSRGAYVMVGISGCGEGNGFEAYAGAIDNDPNAWCDVAFQVQRGNLIVSGTSYTPSTYDWDLIGNVNVRTDQIASGAATEIGASIIAEDNYAVQYLGGTVDSRILGAIGLSNTTPYTISIEITFTAFRMLTTPAGSNATSAYHYMRVYKNGAFYTTFPAATDNPEDIVGMPPNSKHGLSQSYSYTMTLAPGNSMSAESVMAVTAGMAGVTLRTQGLSLRLTAVKV